MISLGFNSVLFKSTTFAEAAKQAAYIGYDGIEISAIKGMCDHLDLDRWEEQASELKTIVSDLGIRFLSTEVASRDEERLMKAFEAAAAIGIPVVNIGPGGKSDVEGDLEAAAEAIQSLAEKAGAFGVTLCVKAHVGSSVYNTPTTLDLMDRVQSEGFGVDMDPSHIYRGNENPEESLSKVIKRVKHIHIRDCIGRGPSPGGPRDQACGRGDINLAGYCKAMVDNKYNGPVSLEVIGPPLDLTQACIVAAESYGYLNACLKMLGAR
ncbi:MAG TPA: sugar phosphate isomerase/epimerase [Clostridiales bacterium]|nr:sugar phosphate isomerase/epimerase [Clostridiales bacterium]